MNTVEELAPSNTWTEVVAQGQWPISRKNEIDELIEKGVGSYISEDKLPFDMNLIGVNNSGSSSSVKMAIHTGMNMIKNVGSALTLGPVFSKKIK
jgi:hypothetical protein